MPNEEEVVIDPTKNNDEGADGDSNNKPNDKSDEGKPNEDKNDKPKETPQEKYARLQGQLKRAAKDAGIEYVEPTQAKPDKPSKKSDELDYGQKAFLMANGVKEADEIKLVKDIMADTGKSMDDVLASKYFQAELKEMQDLKATANAMPNGSKRSGQSAQNSVEYWLAKGELPPASERELRTKVVNARLLKEKSGSQFTSNPVVGK